MKNMTQVLNYEKCDLHEKYDLGIKVTELGTKNMVKIPKILLRY